MSDGKWCSRCGERLPIDCFYPVRADRPERRRSHCKACMLRADQTRLIDPERYARRRESDRAYRARIRRRGAIERSDQIELVALVIDRLLADGLTYREIADRSGVHRNSIAYWHRRTRSVIRGAGPLLDYFARHEWRILTINAREIARANHAAMLAMRGKP